MNEPLKVKSKIVAVIERPDGSSKTYETENIVTSLGDQYYAEAIAGTPSFTIAGMRLGEGTLSATKSDIDVTTFITGAAIAVDGGYPTTNDLDSRNTGAGVSILTWRNTFPLGTIDHPAVAEGALVDDLGTPTAALNHFLFDIPFVVTTVDVLTVFVNHEFIGV